MSHAAEWQSFRQSRHVNLGPVRLPVPNIVAPEFWFLLNKRQRQYFLALAGMFATGLLVILAFVISAIVRRAHRPKMHCTYYNYK